MSDPLGYFITFRTYGTWLHGDKRGSVDREHNAYGKPLLAPNRALEAAQATRMHGSPVELAASHRAAVGDAIRDVCAFRGWTLWALNVRTNHVHVVVSAPDRPEAVLHALKANASRVLRERALETANTRIWSRHGSTRYLWKDGELRDACRYVAESQGNDLGAGL